MIDKNYNKMKKAIEISVLRVSSNGKYIEFIINCPEDYYFTEFTVNVYGSDDIYSLKESLFVDINHEEETSIPDDPDFPELYYYDKQHYIGQFKIADIGVKKPEMYEIHLEARHNENADSILENNLETEECWRIKPVISAIAYISDVSKAYSCLMNDILEMGKDLCDNQELTDKLIRNYLILYAHQEAMHLHELKEARKYFTLLQNCFTSCGTVMNGTCNLCNGGTLTEYVKYDTYKPTNCNCRK